jgi:hypothetical protein
LHRNIENETAHHKIIFRHCVFILGSLFGHLYAHFETAIKIRIDDPTAFGSALLTNKGMQQLFSALPPAIIFYSDKLWTAPPWWVRPEHREFLDSGRGKDPALSNLFIESIVYQATNQDFVECPLRALKVGTPCGCDFEDEGVPTRIPTAHQVQGYYHFLSIWKQLSPANMR